MYFLTILYKHPFIIFDSNKLLDFESAHAEASIKVNWLSSACLLANKVKSNESDL
jgi:hypothetical protein